MNSDFPLDFDGAGSGPLAFLLRHWSRELDRADARARRTGLAGKLSMEAWSRRYLPNHFRHPASRMHGWLFQRLEETWTRRGMKINVLGPRGGAKSTIGTLAYPLHAVVEGREPYVWIVSDTAEQARAHLANLKAELTDNRRLRADYPESTGKGPVWRSRAIMTNNGIAVEAFGTGQRIRGRRHGEHRPTLIVCDDLQNDSHMLSAHARRRSDAWFHGTLLKAGTHRTHVLNLATALHREALAVRLSETPGWTSRVFRAIERWPTNMTLWETWKSLYVDLDNPNSREDALAYYRRNRAAMGAGAELLWPEEEDLYTLMCLRTESGSATFEREKQNSPINPDLCEWPENYFHDRIWFDAWPADPCVKTLALDPSKGRDARRSDYSAFVRLEIDARGFLYVQADMARRPTPEIVQQGVDLYRQSRPDAFGIEANQFQELLGQDFLDEFRRQGLLGVQPYLLNNRVNKQVRIRRLGPYLSTDRLRFKSRCPSTQLLVHQLQEFPAGDHDDGPDALEMAIRLASERLDGSPPDDGLGSRLPVD